MYFKSYRIQFAAMLLLLGLVAGGGVLSPSAVLAQDAEPASEEIEEEEADPYTTLLAEAVSEEGVLTVHQVDGQWYWELPADLLGRELFWYAELSKFPADYLPQLGGPSLGSRMVRFERRGDVIDVIDLSAPLAKRDLSTSGAGEHPTSDEKLSPVQIALEEAATPATILALPIAAEGPDGSIVIDMNAVFADEVAEFSASGNLSLGNVAVIGTAPDRSYVEEMRAFPNNVDVTSHLTFLRAPNPLAFLDSASPPSAASVEVRHSITALPEAPMMPRTFDTRIGYFKVGFDDYSGATANGVVSQEFINRYRLEKQDPDAELSDPIEPIVYYIAPEVPDKWRPYFKQAVEDWQVAFEAAGFSNAIIARDAPTPAEDPDWSPNDTRYSVIRWLAQPIANAMGPNIHDPRTGEILAAHVLIWADVVELAEQWYFLQASAIDEDAQSLPLDEELMGRIVRYVVSHEVGHTLGLRHNHRASQVYSIEQLRDPAFTTANGTTPSIMSYGRFNYIAQPDDGVTSVVPVIGPYDKFAIGWGYMPINDAETPGDEDATLDEWAARQAVDPTLVFGGEDGPASVDPNVLTENLGDDRVEATRLGIQNLERVMGYLAEATTELGSDFDELDKVYQAAVNQRTTWLKSVVKLVGGVEESRTLAGRGDQRFTRVSPDEQRAAVAFIMENLETPQAFLAPDVLNQTTSVNAVATLQSNQTALLDALLNPNKYAQLADGEALDPANAYTVVELLADVQAGLFSEYGGGDVTVDPIRRELQRNYLARLRSQMEPAGSDGAGDDPMAALLAALTPQAGNDLRAAARYNLGQLRASLDAAQPAISNQTTSIHVNDLLAEIDAILAE